MRPSTTPLYSIGVDLGGTNTVYALVDIEGNILRQHSFPTATPTIEEWADKLADGIANITHNIKPESISGIGVGAPCANAMSGCIEGATDLPWPSPIPLAVMIEARTGIKTTISNDANAAAIGEHMYGAAKEMSNFIELTLGTGVGAGVVVDGHLLTGRSGFAGELGHVTFPFASDRLCGCGRKGCLQTVASAKGIVHTAKSLLNKNDRSSSLRGIPDLTAKDVSIAANNGDELALEVLNFTGTCLGAAAAEFAAFADPEAIILFGGVSKAGELLLKPMREEFDRMAIHLYRGKVRFLCSTLKDADAAILGAASLPMMTR
ncbi:MAG: ROK family protein [Muribaculaceae bacterium]|nr:ROK family protein [Muribaculaceae bacterium]